MPDGVNLAESRLWLAEERLRRAREALVATGYFTADQVGDDVAPRITEMFSALSVEQALAPTSERDS